MAKDKQIRVVYKGLESITTDHLDSKTKLEALKKEENSTELYVFQSEEEFLAAASKLSEVDFSASAWMIFVNDTSTLEAVEEAVSHLLSLQSMLYAYLDGVLSEVYKIGRDDASPVIRQEYGRFVSGSTRMLLPDDRRYVWDRRSDLRGHRFRAAFVEFEPFIYFDEEGELTGLMHDIAATLSRALNFTLDMVQTDIYGQRLENGSWIGIVGMLERKEVDLTINDFSITEARSRVGITSTVN